MPNTLLNDKICIILIKIIWEANYVAKTIKKILSTNKRSLVNEQ